MGAWTAVDANSDRKAHGRATRKGIAGYPEPPLSEELALDLPPGKRWAVCLTHDIDHLGLREHLVDLFLCRYAVNLARQNLLHRFRPGRLIDSYWGIVLAALGRDRWDVVPALLEREQRAGVISTWFVPIRRGLGVNYGPEEARETVRLLVEAGQEVALHGQSPGSSEEMRREAEDLAALSGRPVLGLRMHYLRLTSAVLDGASAARMVYDSSVMDRTVQPAEEHPLWGPRLIRPGVVEFPVHAMDTDLFSFAGFGLDLAGAVDYVRRLMRRAAETGRLLVICLHPNYYSRQSPEMRDWYDAVLDELASYSDVFVTDMRGLAERVRSIGEE